MFGLAREICGELGFGWCRRLMMLHALLAPGADVPEAAREVGRRLGARYGYDPDLAKAAPARAAGILRMLAARLRSQEQRGSPFFVGDRLSALDLYWAAFAALVEPLPDALCPMPRPLRAVYTARDPALREAAHGLLLEHRDRIYRDYLKLPLDF